MSRCTNDTYSKYTITSADQIKNVAVDLTNLVSGYSLVYENNKFVLKDVQGGSGGGGTETGITIADVLNVIKQGTGIAIDRGTENEITISSDTTQYIKTNTTVATSTLVKPIQIIEFYDTTRQMLQNFNTNNKENTMVLIVNNSSYNINVSSLGVLVNPNSASLFIKAVNFMQVLTIKNYDTKISSIEGSIESLNVLVGKCLTNNSAIYELSDVPNYNIAEDGSALTKTSTGLEWKKGIGVKDITDNIKEGTNITITREDTGAITINSTGGGTGGVTKQEVLDSIIAGDNITINRDTQGQITVSATGGSGGGVTFTDQEQELNLVTSGTLTPFDIWQTGGANYSTLGASPYPCKVRTYSNGDMEVDGIVNFKVKDLSTIQTGTLSDAIRFILYLPVPADIEVTKKYETTRTGIYIAPNPLGNMPTGNTFYRSSTSSSQVKFVLVQFGYTCFGVNNAYYKELSNKTIPVSFQVKLRAVPKA